MNDSEVIEATRRWIADIVVGLNLCPFARRVFEGGLIRFTVTAAKQREGLLADLDSEISLLQSQPRTATETTLLILPGALPDFRDFNDFLADANDLIDDRRLRGVLQIASFHPFYQFQGATPDDVENYTNRSPYPMLHLLREESITEVADRPETLLGIPERNMELLRRLGLAGIEAVGRGQRPGV